MTDKMAPILQLPLIVQHQLIQSLDVDDIFTFSMTGSSAKNTIRRMEWHIVATMMDFQTCIGRTTIIGTDGGLTEKATRWKIMKNEEGNFIPQMKINKTVFNITQFNPLLKTDSWTNDDFRRWFIRCSLIHFSDLFGYLRRIGTSMLLNQMRILADGGVIKQCEIVDQHAHARQITDFCNRFSGRALILRPTVQGAIDINCSIMRIAHVFLQDAPWLTGAHLLEFTGKNLFAFNTTIYTEDVVQVVRKWMNGTSNRLRSIVLTLRNGIPFDREDVMRSVPEAKPWDREKRERFYIYKESWKMQILTPHMNLLDCATGMDIIRESDDMVATIRMTPTAFCFFVWHRRFPNAMRGN